MPLLTSQTIPASSFLTHTNDMTSMAKDMHTSTDILKHNSELTNIITATIQRRYASVVLCVCVFSMLRDYMTGDTEAATAVDDLMSIVRTVLRV